MTIAVFSENLHSCGASIAALRSARLLARRHGDVEYVFEKSRNLSAVRAIFPGVRFTHVKQEFIATYRRKLRAEAYDYVVLNNFTHETRNALWMTESAPVLWKLHDASAFAGFNYAMRDLRGDGVTWYSRRKGFAQRADLEALAGAPFAFAAPSRWIADLARAYVGDAIDVHLVRNAVPSAYFRPLGKAGARAALGLPEDRFVVLFFAGASAAARKNLELVIRAAHRVGPRALFVAIGAIPAGATPPPPHMMFLPAVSAEEDPLRPAQLMSAADVFVLSSLVDNFPNTVLEAQACGAPVIATRAGGAPEMLLEGETGWLTDPRDPAALAERIEALIADPAAAAAAGRRASAFAAETFSEEASLAQYERALEALDRKRAQLAGPRSAEPEILAAEPEYDFRPPPSSRLAALARNRPLRPDSHIAPYRQLWSPSHAEASLLSFRYRMAADGWPLTDNERRIEAWRNAYRGRRAFLIGNGPSLNACDLGLLRDEITIGVNSIFFKADELGGLPTHYVVEDNFVAEDRAAEINALRGTNKWFGNYLRYCLHGEDVHWLNVRMRYDAYPGFPYFSRDALRQVWTGGSVTYVCMQLAFYFGVRELILVGFDHHYVVPAETEIEGMAYTSQVDDPNHFDPRYFGKGYRWHAPMTERMEIGYRRAGAAFARHGRRIRNATVGGRLEVFERVDYRSLFA